VGAPKDTDELLYAIATMDYGVSDDRSSKLAAPAIKAYNSLAGTYQKASQKRGQPLHEGFTIVKVREIARLPEFLRLRPLLGRGGRGGRACGGRIGVAIRRRVVPALGSGTGAPTRNRRHSDFQP
jgi:hypothetical protein